MSFIYISRIIKCWGLCVCIWKRLYPSVFTVALLIGAEMWMALSPIWWMNGQRKCALGSFPLLFAGGERIRLPLASAVFQLPLIQIIMSNSINWGSICNHCLETFAYRPPGFLTWEPPLFTEGTIVTCTIFSQWPVRRWREKNASILCFSVAQSPGVPEPPSPALP